MKVLLRNLSALVLSLFAANGLAATEVCVEDANLRSSGSMELIIDTLGRGTPVKVLSSTKKSFNNNDYVQVEANGNSGWIVASFICELGGNLPVTARKIVVNITTNRLSYYENGQLVDSWNIGTARAGKVTPVGTYAVRQKEKCPPYFGSKGDHNTPGCTPENPFGRRVLWFIGNLYGIHGTNQEYLLSSSTTANQRRVSGGCVRNPNNKIEWLFDRVKVGDPIIVTR